jgi:hypothetical protein
MHICDYVSFRYWGLKKTIFCIIVLLINLSWSLLAFELVQYAKFLSCTSSSDLSDNICQLSLA